MRIDKPSSRGPLPSLTAAISLTLASAAAAAQTAETSEPPRQLPKVSVEADEPETYQTPRVSSAKITTLLRDEPRTITVVPQKLIEERGAATLGEALRNVPGITLVAGEGGGARGDQFRIRGFAAQNDIFFDGMREVAQFSNRDPFNLQAVEIAKGPDSAFGGRGSTGGSINQVSKLPILEQALSSTLAVGTESYVRATGDLSQPFGEGAALRLNAMYHDQEVEGRDGVTNSRWGIAPTIGFGLDSPTRLILGYYHLDQDNITDYGLPTTAGELVVDVDRSNWYGFDGLNAEDSRADVGTARVEHDVNDRVSLRSQFRYAENDLWSIVTPPRNANEAANTVTRNPNVRDSVNTLAINQTDATIRLGSGAIEHTVVTGFEVSRELYKTRAYTLAPAAPLDNLTDPDPNTPYDPTFNDNGSTENTGDTLAAFL
ncbi:MAG TPA: TonB-dependent receptor plug domain-containing protein, partial [Steroidobacteraceae bacterium]|nr:TonB-dependent receptor plug domain-containing protein [Steroidobacteraceae bacterium]